MNKQLEELFNAKTFSGRRKIIISSAGTSRRNELGKHLKLGDVLYANVLPNPNISQVLDFFQKIKPSADDIVFGVGGGSVIDFSKLVALFSDIPFEKIKQTIEATQFASIERVLKLVLIPTLFGSGAEQTPFSVCYIGDKKYSVTNNLILPERVEYIAELNLSANSSIKLFNVLDCFCQAAESITARSANVESIENAQAVLRILLPNAKNYIINKNLELASLMAQASELCGKAISTSKTTGPHAMSYYLTSRLGWEHGKAVGMTFLFFLYYYEKVEIKNNRKCERLIISLQKHFGSAVSTYEAILKYFISLNLDVYGLASEIDEKIEPKEWIRDVNAERLMNGPVVSPNWLNARNVKEFFGVILKHGTNKSRND